MSAASLSRVLSKTCYGVHLGSDQSEVTTSDLLASASQTQTIGSRSFLSSVRMGSLDEFILELATVEAIKFGSFTLKSGQVAFCFSLPAASPQLLGFSNLL